MQRRRIALPLALLVLSAPTLDAQPEQPQTRAREIFQFLSDADLQKELALTPEQVGKLRAERKQSAKLAMSAEREAKVLRETFDPSQLKRAEQIAVQKSLGAWLRSPPDYSRFEARRLSLESELIKALKLNMTQQSMLSGMRPSGTVYLTSEQVEAARQVLGRPVSTFWAYEESSALDSRLLRTPSPSFSALALTEARAVQAELKLNSEQMQSLSDLRKTYLDFAFLLKNGQRIVPEAETALEKALSEAQFVRLRQVETQQRPRGLQLTDAWEDPETAMALKLTPAQVEAIKTEHRKYKANVLAIAPKPGTTLKQFDDAVRAAIAVKEDAIRALLTADQKSLAASRFGDPIEVRVLRGSSKTRSKREASFGHYQVADLENLVMADALRLELDLSAEQLQTLRAAASRISTLRRADAERSKVIGATLAETLTEKQAKRYRQIMLREREQVGSRAGDYVGSAVSFPGVAEEVKLTGDQKARLIEGEEPLEVLSPDQHLSIADMLGEPFHFILDLATIDHPDNQLPRTGVITSLPWAELKMTPEQVTQVATLLNRHQVDLASAPPTHRPGTIRPPGGATPTQLAQKLEEDLPKLLTIEQRQRLDQLAAQRSAARNLRVALFDHRRELNLTSRQMTAIIEKELEEHRLVRLVRSLWLSEKSKSVLFRAIRDRTDDETLNVLNEEQRKLWEKRTGAPSPFLLKRIPGSPYTPEV